MPENVTNPLVHQSTLAPFQPVGELLRQFTPSGELCDVTFRFTADPTGFPHGTKCYAVPPNTDIGHVLLPIEPTEELIDATRSLFMGLELGCNSIESMRTHLRMIGEDMAMFPDWFQTETGHLTKAGRGILAYAMIVAAARKEGV